MDGSISSDVVYISYSYSYMGNLILSGFLMLVSPLSAQEAAVGKAQDKTKATQASTFRQPWLKKIKYNCKPNSGVCSTHLVRQKNA